MQRIGRTFRNPLGRQLARRGAVTLEFIIAMPVLFTAFLAIFEFGFLALVIENGTHAVNEGTREGAKLWGSSMVLDNNTVDYDPTGNDDIADQIALAIDKIVGVFRMEVRQNGIHDDSTKANVLVVIERGANPLVRRGNVALTCKRTGDPPGANEIVVTICFPLVDSSVPSTDFGNPVPNWLVPFGFNLSSHHFHMSARSELE